MNVLHMFGLTWSKSTDDLVQYEDRILSSEYTELFTLEFPLLQFFNAIMCAVPGHPK